MIEAYHLLVGNCMVVNVGGGVLHLQREEQPPASVAV